MVATESLSLTRQSLFERIAAASAAVSADANNIMEDNQWQ